MAHRTLNGWLVREHPCRGTFVAPNGKTVYCADDDVATVFGYVATQWDKRIEKLPQATYNTYPNEREGYIVIHSSRPSPLNGLDDSNHLSGTGMDILGDRHHYERSCTMANGNSCWGDGKPHKYISGFSARQLSELKAIQKEIGRNANGDYVLRLGATDFAMGWRDAMHVEISPGTTNADVRAAALRLRAVEGVQDLTEYAESLLALSYPATPEGVRAYQVANTGDPHHLAVDGILGPKTATALEADMAKLQDLEKQLATILTAIDTGMDSEQNREGVGTGRDLTLGELARLNAARINTQRARHWDLVRAISATSADPEAVGLVVADAIRDDVKATIREAIQESGIGGTVDTEAVIAEIRSRLEPEGEA